MKINNIKILKSNVKHIREREYNFHMYENSKERQKFDGIDLDRRNFKLVNFLFSKTLYENL